MKSKILGIFVCLMLFAIIIPTVSSLNSSTEPSKLVINSLENWKYKLYVFGTIKDFVVNEWDTQFTVVNGFIMSRTYNQRIFHLLRLRFIHNRFIVVPWDHTFQGYLSDSFIFGVFTVYRAPFL